MSETFTATGRRKTAVARVWLTAGTGSITINNEPFEDVLTTLTLQGQLLEPLQVTNLKTSSTLRLFHAAADFTDKPMPSNWR